MVATYIKKILHSMNCVTDVCSRETVYMFFVGQVSGLVENVNIRIFADTINLWQFFFLLTAGENCWQ